MLSLCAATVVSLWVNFTNGRNPANVWMLSSAGSFTCTLSPRNSTSSSLSSFETGLGVASASSIILPDRTSSAIILPSLRSSKSTPFFLTVVRNCVSNGKPETVRIPAPAKIGRDTSELQSLTNLVCRLLLEKKNKIDKHDTNTIKKTSKDISDEVIRQLLRTEFISVSDTAINE